MKFDVGHFFSSAFGKAKELQGVSGPCRNGSLQWPIRVKKKKAGGNEFSAALSPGENLALTSRSS